MKKLEYLIIAILAMSLWIGLLFLSIDYINPPVKSCELCEKHQEIEENTTKLLDNMWKIFDRHDLLDADGSDEMSELLEAQDNLAYIYNW